MSDKGLLAQLEEAILQAPTDRLGEIEQRLKGLIDFASAPVEKKANPPEVVDNNSPLEVSNGEMVYAWSDGSCLGNPGPGGWAYVIRMGAEEWEGSAGKKQTTNNIMEMTGALKALEALPEGTSITLETDSQYVVKGMTQWLRGWKKKNWKKSDGNPVLNQELWKQLDAANQARKVTWKWVKGHAGHAENERCDDLARAAAEEL